MKILMLTDRMDCGGAETHIEALSQALSDRGHSVWVASSGGRIAQKLAAGGIKHEGLALDSHNPLKLIAVKKRIESLVCSEDIDILHAHSRMAAYIACRVAKRHGKAFVTTVHARFSTSAVKKGLSRWGSLTVAVSQDLKQYLCEEYGVLSDNVYVIPNGIDVREFAPLDRTERGENFRVTFMSRMDRDCSLGARLLCDIAPRLSERIPNLKIRLVGGGNDFGKIKKRAERANARVGRECVHAVGYCSDVRAALEGSDAFVGVSRATLEAMMLEIPVVLCGNEGFGGILDGSNFRSAAEGNFCCRGLGVADGDKLFGSIMEIYSKSYEERAKLGREISNMCRIKNPIGDTAERVESVYSEALRRVPRVGHGVLLCGYYGFGNLGDDVLLARAIKRCEREHGEYPVVALTDRGARDNARFGVRCVSRHSPLAVAREIKRTKIFVFGGGTLLQESTSRRSLLYYASLLGYAKKRGARCELWANGIGAPRGKRGGKIIAESLGKCDYIGLRDSASLKLAGELLCKGGIASPQMQYERDMAICPVPIKEERTDFLMERYRLATKKENGFAVVAVKGGIDRKQKNRIVHLAEEMRTEGRGLLFLPMFPREDMRLAKYLAKRLGGEVAKGLGASDVVGIMKRADLVIGMRLHALVFAFVAGTRFAGLGEDSKLKSFCEENGGTVIGNKIEK